MIQSSRHFSSLVVLSLAACAAASSTGPQAGPTPTSIDLPPPSRSIHLRASFDKDPSVYVGRFVKDDAKPDDLDENAAFASRCSKFVKVKTVDTQQEVDETMFASRSVAAGLGLPALAQVSAGRESGEGVHVHYTVTKKIQSDIDTDGLGACCKADPSQCTSRIIGEFVMGTGEVSNTTASHDHAGANGITPQGITGGIGGDQKSGTGKKVAFKDVYFAFQTTATPFQAGGAPVTDCSFCDSLPGSLDGKYFCGVASDAPNEADARDAAMRNAREQVVRYLGESLSVATAAKTDAVKGLIGDQKILTSAASGVAARVKDEKWCKPERFNTPEGEHVRLKVLAFFPKASEGDATKAVAEAAIAGKRAGGAPGVTLSADDEKAIREAAAKTK